ncbi:hypothetical protein ACYPKM_03255 [Pseudomonas aeruginosa]
MKAKLPGVAAELNLKCDAREIGDVVRFEFCNEPSLVWSNTIISILDTRRLEEAFMEFVILQGDRLIIGISNVLAVAGIHYEAPPDHYALAVVKDSYAEDAVSKALSKDFHVVSTDNRDPRNLIFGVITARKLEVHPLNFYREAEKRMKEAGFDVTFRHTMIHESKGDLSLDSTRG